MKKSAAEKKKKEGGEEGEGEEKDKDKAQEDNDTTVRIELGQGISYICVNSLDVEDIQYILTYFHKRFHVLAAATERSQMSLIT